VRSRLLAQLRKLAVACLEHALERADGVAVVHRALVERVQVLAAPELALEFQRLRHRAAQDEPLLEDEHPGHERHGEQHHHDHLHHEARVKDQRPDVQILRDVRH
jgi:ABC-type nickel/cobalt efflux system permease component RcnA